MSFFVISRGSWGIQADDFVRRLRSQWPAAVIRELKNPARSNCLEFELPMRHSRVEGGLSREGRSISFDSDMRDAARLALWFRTLAPVSEPMVLCDEGMSGSIELEPGTTEADIFRAFSYTPAPPGWMNYEIIPRGGWGVPVQVLAQQMRLRWPSAQVVESEDSDSRWIIEFYVPMPHSKVRGDVRRKVNAMVFTGDMRDCAEFALWCRSVVPAEELFLLCDRGNIDLKAGMGVDDVLGALGGPPSDPVPEQ